MATGKSAEELAKAQGTWKPRDKRPYGKPKKPKKPVGRPKKLFKNMPTQLDLPKIEALAGYGLSIQKIALVFGVSDETFRTYIKEKPEIGLAMERGRANAEAAVTQSAYQQAVSGKVPNMTQYWLNCRAGWKTTQVVEHSGGMDINAKIQQMSVEQREARIRALAEELGYTVPAGEVPATEQPS